MKNILCVGFTLFSSMTFANTFEGCGVYKFHGVLKIKPLAVNKLEYIVNGGNQSQMRFEFSKREDAQKLIPYLDKTSSFKAEIQKTMDATKGVVSNITEISERVPNPMKTENTGISLITKKKCQ